ECFVLSRALGRWLDLFALAKNLQTACQQQCERLLRSQVTSSKECSSLLIVILSHQSSADLLPRPEALGRRRHIPTRFLFWLPLAKVCLLWSFYLFVSATAVSRAADTLELAHRPWFEARSTHFHTYSCGST